MRCSQSRKGDKRIRVTHATFANEESEEDKQSPADTVDDCADTVDNCADTVDNCGGHSDTRVLKRLGQSIGNLAIMTMAENVCS